MSEGALEKSNATTWSDSICKKSTASAWSDGVIKHSDGTTWHDNYPMEQLYEQYFNVSWTQAYNGTGVKLDTATWGVHPRVGDTIGFMGFFGFDNAALKNFVGNGVVTGLQIEVMFDDPEHIQHPDVKFAAHTYTSKPSSASWNAIKTAYFSQSKFWQTGEDFKRWVSLPVGAWSNGEMAGVAVFAAENIAANSARFAGNVTSHGLNAFNTRLFVQVLK